MPRKSNTTSDFLVVYVTAPKGAVSRKIASAVLASRLAACVTIIASVESHYRWKGKLEKSGESLLVIKTKKSLFEKLSAVILKNHPYVVPEIISLPIQAGHAPYLGWIKKETRAS